MDRAEPSHSAALRGHSLHTSAGIFVATFTRAGLARLDFPTTKSCIRPTAVTVPPRWLAATKRGIESILKGAKPRALPPLDLTGATPFQRAVWRQLQLIPAGQTRSYAAIARAIGRPRAARAVGAACGANPIPLLIPCHRVIASDGSLGGFSGGLDWKRRLLALELVRNGSAHRSVRAGARNSSDRSRSPVAPAPTHPGHRAPRSSAR